MSLIINIVSVTNGVMFYGKHTLANIPKCKTCLKYKKLGFSRDGLYILYPDSHPEGVLAYCDMTTDGGGWTLVLSNRRGSVNKPAVDADWAKATGTGVFTNEEPNEEGDYDLFTGLGFWNEMMGGENGGELRYQWINADTNETMQDFKADIERFSEDDQFRLKLYNPRHIVGEAIAGLLLYQNLKKFSTIDMDNDNTEDEFFAKVYRVPWWYGRRRYGDYEYGPCWHGSIYGGGEFEANGFENGAYFRTTDDRPRHWLGDGVGNGKMWIR
jgi:hypothetical protein